MASSFLTKTKVQAAQILNQTYNYVAEKFGQSNKTFSQASAYGQILSVISQLSTMITYFIEDSVTEQNILTASRTQSIYGLARLAGHDATRAIAAKGEIGFTVTKIPEITGKQIIIPNFTTLKCINNSKTYMLNLIDDQMRVDITSGKTYNAQVIQGELQTVIYTGNGNILQSYTAITKGSVLVDNFYINIFVNGVKWKKYDSLYDIPRDGLGYLVKTGISGGIDIYFGNSNFGKIPPSGAEIRVEYLQTSGVAGNLLEGDDIEFKWDEPGYSIVGEEVDLNEALTTDMSKLISFGADPESTALTRLIAPKTSRSYVLANPDNYIIFLEKFNYFGVIDAFTTFDDDNLEDDNVIYLFLIPDITKRITSSQNYFNMPLSYFTLTDYERSKVLDVIEDSGSKIVTTVVKILEPNIKKYVVNISLAIFEGYSQDVIKNDIIEKLSQYFLKLRRRDLIPASDLIAIIENVKGVDAVNLTFVSEENEADKKANPTSTTLYGLDEMGDIVINKDELVMIRGGWKDRNGITYADGIFDNEAGSVNINIKKISPENINSQLRAEDRAKIMSS
jgi:hypothetical protein